MSKFLKMSKVDKINIKFSSILKYIQFHNLKKINNINKWNNNNKKKKMMKLRDHLMNFLKIYMKLVSVINKYLKLLLIQSQKNKLINNSLQI